MAFCNALRCCLSRTIKSRYQCALRSVRNVDEHLPSITRLVSSYSKVLHSPPSKVKHQYNGRRALNVSSKSTTTEVQLEIQSKGRILEISWADGFTSRYHSIWLRNHCQCASCKQAHSGQKLIDQQDISLDCELKSTEIKDGAQLKICWQESDHEGTIQLDFLRKNSYSREALDASAKLRDYSFFEGPLQEFDYKDLSSCKKAYFRWLQCLDVYGIAIVTNVPCQEKQIVKVAELISFVQPTLYGEVFNVVATDEPINVAYTNAMLDYHMDLMYYESPPGLQLLHCLRFDDEAEGGQSVFLDVFHSVAEFRKDFPHHFETLTRVPVTFQKIHFERENPAAYMYQRPHITVNPQGQGETPDCLMLRSLEVKLFQQQAKNVNFVSFKKPQHFVPMGNTSDFFVLVVTAVNWSPPFEGPLKVSEEDVEPYYAAYQTFANLLENSSVKVEHRMRNGECVIFNNRRILHGRKQFTLNGGQRHFQGCYVNIDDFRSRVQQAYIQEVTGELTKRCGNQCWF